MSAPDHAAVLAERVHASGGTKPFGEMTAAEVHERADEVGAVARAWAELERAMDAAGAATVADLDPAAVTELAGRLWVVPRLL